MLGPEKDGIFVEEYLPYKMMAYSGDLSDVNIMYDLSSTYWASYTGFASGVGYIDMMTNQGRNQKMRSILNTVCPKYWTSPYGNIRSYQGRIPVIPDFPGRTEHQTIEFSAPTLIITAGENIDPRTGKQVTV